MAVCHGLFGEPCHHYLGNFIGRFAPNIHHFVVALASSHQTGHILLFDFFDLFLSAGHDFVFLVWYQHVIDTYGDARFGCQPETRLQQLVGKYNRLFQSTFAERNIDQFGDFLFLQRFVQVGERQTFRQNFRQQSTASRGFPELGRTFKFTAVLVLRVFSQTHIDTCIQTNFASVKGAAHFTGVREHQAFAFVVGTFTGRVIQAQHHVLRRHDGRFAIRREQHVVGCQH